MTPPGHWITQVNGNWVDSVSVRDRGLAYGDGLFETMRYQQGHLPLWTYHLDRLRLGCTRLCIPLNETLLEHSLKSFISRLEEQGVSSALVKLTVTRGCGGRGYAPPWPADTQPSMIFQSQPISGSDSLATNGIALQLCHTRIFPNPPIAGIKHLNRLDYVLAAQELPEDPRVQGLLLDSNGRLLECLHHNLFLVVEGWLKTPRLQEAGVHGVMRRLLMERLAFQMGLEVAAEDLELHDLNGAKEVFICNALRGIWPVVRIGEQQWAGAGSVTRRLQACVDQLLDGSVVLP